MKRKVLFVDDEPNVLRGLRRLLRGMRHEWDMVFVESGAEALEALEKGPFDVIVTDMRMPGMDGADLLSQVMERYPWIVRIVLSGHSEKEMILKAARPTHQFLSKPCDPELLKATVARACALRDVVTNKTAREAVSKIDALPALPDVYVELMEQLRSPASSAATIGRIIAKDGGLTADILKMANSSFFGFARHISSPEEAVALLGVEVVQGLILSAHLMGVYNPDKISGFSLEALWTHCQAVGGMARQIARSEIKDRRVIDHAYIAGLLHDVGKLVLAASLSDEFNAVMARVRAEDRLVWEVERELLGTSHAEIGAYLLGLWGLPDAVVEALTFHHLPSASQAPGFTPLTAVHAADVLEHELVKINEHYDVPQFDMDYLASRHLTDRLPQWRALCIEHLGVGDDDEG